MRPSRISAMSDFGELDEDERQIDLATCPDECSIFYLTYKEGGYHRIDMLCTTVDVQYAEKKTAQAGCSGDFSI